MTKPLQHSYLLRLWREQAGAPMRVTLIPVESPDKPQHFANLDDLFTLLSAQAYPATPAIDRPRWDGDHCTPDGPA
jgi:hypothetical protein